MVVSQKIKIELLYDSAIPLPGICPEELKTGPWRDMCTFIFIAALFTIIKTWKQPKVKWKWKSLSCVQFFATLGLCSPWNSPGQNTGVGCLSILQGIFPTQGSNPGLPHYRWILYQLSYKGSPSVDELISTYTSVNYYSVKKEYILQWMNSTWMNLEDFILRAINQSQKDKYYMIPLIWIKITDRK